ncbi:hypothetical protein MTR67_031042 [Solanum verrucosum]|uniref:Uncharacterized protein n=1 Tax=Solanum verrucosum TaxID=315347 RepID=A0AAF0U1Q0_SOLVR|nr:hypothetical protein MTR67_031042 [Solanum verrucosum]
MNMFEHLRIVLQVFNDRQLFAKSSKCNFWLRFVAFLGHIFSSYGIKVDPRKFEVVKNWPRPLSDLDNQSFFGLASYYRRYVEGFSSISSPLTPLTQRKYQQDLMVLWFIVKLLDMVLVVF